MPFTTRKIIRTFNDEEKHKYEEIISNWASTSFYPSAVNLIKVHTDNEPLCIEVIPGKLTPYQLKKKSNLYTYVRNNSLTEPASAESIKKLINKSNLDAFDEQTSDIQQLNFSYLEEKFNAVHKKFNPQKLSGFLSKDQRYSNTALLLSEENPYSATVAIFGSEKTLESLEDSRRFQGSIFNQIDKMLEYINLNNHTHSEITGNPQRKDKRDFPPVAIRESLINAFAHRSYIDCGPIQIKIYSDRIEILSPGSLPGGLTVGDVLAGRNYPRNHNVVYALSFLRYVEDLGTGIDRIEDSYETGEVTEQPKLEAGENFVKLILPNQNYAPAPTNVHVLSTNDPTSVEIVIGSDEPDNALKLETLYHEYAHSQLHGLTSEFKDQPRAYQETQAEAVAYVAMQNIGADTSNCSLGYVATWAKDTAVIHEALSEIQKVSNKVVDLSNELTEKLGLQQEKGNKISESLEEVAKEKLVVQADNPVQAVQKLYNNNLESAIQDSFTLSDVSEKEAQHFLKTVKWEDVADIEKSNNAIKALGNGYYADEYIDRDDTNPHSANQSILKNHDTEHPTLSQQYKNLLKQVQDPAKNNQQAEKQREIVKYNRTLVDKKAHRGL